MRRIRETLRLHLQAGLSYNEVARALKISKSVVGKYVLLARVAGVDWEIAQTLSDEDLEARLYRPAVPACQPPTRPTSALDPPGAQARRRHADAAVGGVRHGQPAGLQVHQLLHQVRASSPRRQQRSMRQIHIAGEKLFVDYAGGTVPIIDAATGEITQAADLRGHAGRVELHLRLRHRRARPPPTGSARRCRRWSSSAACPA